MPVAPLEVFSEGTGGNLPRPAPRQAARAGVWLSFAGRSAVPRRGRCEPAFLPQRCSCRAVACGDRGVSCDMGRRPLVRRRWRCGHGFLNRMARDASPGCRHYLARRDSSASIKDSALSRRAPGTFRRFHGAAALPRPDVTYSRPMPAWRIRPDSPLPPVMRRHGASVPTGASPHAIRDTWHRGSRGTWTSPAASYGCRALPDSRRLSGPPRSGRNGSRPTTIRRSLGGAEYTPGTKAAPEKNV